MGFSKTTVLFLLYIGYSWASLVAPTLTLNDGNRIPVLSLGTGRGTAKPGDSKELVQQAVFWAIEAGYRHIDTAAIYDDETEVGRGIAEAIKKGLVKREDLFITTKLWNDKHAFENVKPALEESLKRLGLDYVDLYLIHSPISTKADGSPDTIDYLDTWKGMEDVKKAGLAKSIGVSNFNTTQLERLVENSQIKPAVNQIEVNPTLTQEPLVNRCKDLGVAVMAYSPFGFIVSRKSADAPPPSKDDPLLKSLGDKYKKSSGQIVLRYLVDRGLVPVAKSTNQDRIKENLDIFDFKLTEEEVASINKFNKNKRVISWTGYENYPNYPFFS